MPLIFKLIKHKTQDGTISYHPKIPITLIHNDKIKSVMAVLDTGSDLIYIPKNIAEYFGLELSKETFEAKTPNSLLEYKTARILIRLEKKHYFKNWNFKVMIPLSEFLDEIILGTPFLSNFKVLFDYEKNQIELKEITKKT